jgi:hypothetical protein
MRRKAKAVIAAADNIKKDAQRVQSVSRQDIEDVAEKYSRASSTFLAAVVGGSIGAAGGLAVGTFGGAVLVVSGPLGLALGAALGVLAFRRPSYWRLERATQKTGAVLNVLRDVAERLPPDAPPELRHKIYDHMDDVVGRFAEVASRTIDD